MNSRVPTMTRADRQARHQRIIELAKAGNPPSVIARHIGLTRDHVRQVVMNSGIKEKTPLPLAKEQHLMWEMDEDARRDAIIRRAAKGARRTIRDNYLGGLTYPHYPQTTDGIWKSACFCGLSRAKQFILTVS